MKNNPPSPAASQSPGKPMATAPPSGDMRHISTNLHEHEQMLREALYSVLLKAAVSNEEEPLRVLDIGCGKGEFLERLADGGHQTYGIDIEDYCVGLSERFGTVRRGGFEDLDRLFAPGDLDVVVSSHVLEHVDSPRDCLKAARKLHAKRYVFAVPNVHRCARIIRILLGSASADHPTHFYGWGRPEFAALLTDCGYHVTRWHSDRVTINPLAGKRGAFVGRLLSPLETRLLPRIAPLLSSSLIAECTPAHC